MNWISDVNYEASKLEYSKKNLRKFGITLGVFFGILGIWFTYSNTFTSLQALFAGISLFLILCGVLFPKSLRIAYRYWMIGAFIMGWFVSRFLLTILFFLVVTPIAIIAKILKKEFMNTNYNKKQQSYWIRKTTTKINYEKMY